MTLGDVRFQAGDVRGAEEAYTRAIQIDAESHLGWMRRGAIREVLAESTSSPELRTAALADLDTALARKPGDPETLKFRAVSRMWLKDFEGARADLEAARRGNPRPDVLREIERVTAYLPKR